MMSSSKIIRQAVEAPTVFVGERRLDFDRQEQAEKTLGELFQFVAVTTDADGAKFVPIEEIFKIEKVLNQAKQDAYQHGFQEGQKAGLEQGLARAREVIQQFEKAISDAIEQRQQLLEEARQKILELTIEISKKVTFDAIQLDPEITSTIISGVIDTLLDRSQLKIHVHPDHLPIVEQHMNTFLSRSSSIKDIAIVPDPRVRYGGCFIETPTGDIDARLESQFEVIKDVILSGEEES